MKINQTRSYCFINGNENIHSDYQFINALNGIKSINRNLLLIITLNNDQLKIAKPESILKQPDEIIDKIVEREIRSYFEEKV